MAEVSQLGWEVSLFKEPLQDQWLGGQHPGRPGSDLTSHPTPQVGDL